MSKQVFLDDLDQALSAAGIPFTAVMSHPSDATGSSSWQGRGRPPSTGGFEPTGILCHHTASPSNTSSETDVAVILAGNGSAPGPISQLYLGRSGDVRIIAAGRANHGGSGVRPGVDSRCEDMNEALLGIEAGNNGVGERWGDAMCEMYARVVAALCDWYGWDIDPDVYLHATTGPPNGGCNSKIDPAGPWSRQPSLVGSTTWDLGVWRQYCAEFTQAPRPPGDGDMAYVIYESVDAAGNRWAWADFIGIEAGGLCESVVWIDGNYKAQIEQSGAAVEHKRRAPGGYQTFRLEGGMPQGDQQYQWSDRPGVDFRKVT